MHFKKLIKFVVFLKFNLEHIYLKFILFIFSDYACLFL